MRIRIELLGFHLEFGHDQPDPTPEEPVEYPPNDTQYPLMIAGERPYVGFYIDGEGGPYDRRKSRRSVDGGNR